MPPNRATAFRTAEQAPLIIETFEDAVLAWAYQAGGKKAAATIMRPDFDDDPERGLRWFLDCINPDRREVFHPEHILRAIRHGRSIGCHVLMGYVSRDGGYEDPRPASPKSERTLLAEKAAACAVEHARLLRELDRYDNEPRLSA